MTHPYPKYEVMLDRVLTNAERLEPARDAFRTAMRLLEQAERNTSKASDLLTDEQLELVCLAARNALLAAENAAFLGVVGFQPHPLEAIEWRDADEEDLTMKSYNNPDVPRLTSAIAKALPKDPIARIWAKHEDEILCENEQIAETIADLFDALYGGPTVNTGYYDPEEDERNGETDETTGFWYVTTG